MQMLCCYIKLLSSHCNLQTSRTSLSHLYLLASKRLKLSIMTNQDCVLPVYMIAHTAHMQRIYWRLSPVVFAAFACCWSNSPPPPLSPPQSTPLPHSTPEEFNKFVLLKKFTKKKKKNKSEMRRTSNRKNQLITGICTFQD